MKNLFITNLHKKDVNHFTTNTGLFLRKKRDKPFKKACNLFTNANIIRVNGVEGMHAPHVMLGYYENEAETKSVLKRHDDGYVWVHSGDLGYIDEDGCVFIQGRIKRMIVRYDGFKVYPTLIESVVASFPGVKACCAVGTPDIEQSQGMLPIVFVVLNSGFEEVKVKQSLMSLCQQELPEYAQPIDFRVIDEIPLTLIGKVDYKKLEREAQV